MMHICHQSNGRYGTTACKMVRMHYGSMHMEMMLLAMAGMDTYEQLCSLHGWYEDHMGTCTPEAMAGMDGPMMHMPPEAMGYGTTAYGTYAFT